MKLKIISMFLAIIVIAGAFFSCNNEIKQEETTGTTSNDEPSRENGDEKIVLSTDSKALFYFNDPGHIISCINERNPDRSQIVTKARLDGAVTEATDAGFDVFVNEIYGMVPWYPSEIYSLEEHNKWFYEEFGGQGSYGLMTYLRNGKDFVQEQLDKTHEEGKLYFLSYRMNDRHSLNLMDNPSTAPYKWTSKFYVENPQYRIGESQNNLGASGWMLDFQYKEVRDYKLAMIYELIENYDIDGILLDFMRSPAYFNLHTTTEEQRIAIMTDFMKSVKAALDKKTEETGKEYYFGVVIPREDGEFGDLGIDLDKYVEAGVEIFIFWDYYFSTLDYDLVEDFKIMHPECLAYVMLSQATSYVVGANPMQFRFTTPEQFYTCAYTAYAHNADGISVFNFPFYRNWQHSPDYGLGYSPPFEIVKNLKDTEFLKSAPQHYFYGVTENYLYNEFDITYLVLGGNTTSMDFELDVTLPEGGFVDDGILKLEMAKGISGIDLTVKIGGVTLRECAYEGEPYNNPYKEVIGSAEQMKCFIVPSGLLEDGENIVSVTLKNSEKSVSFTFFDLAIK